MVSGNFLSNVLAAGGNDKSALKENAHQTLDVVIQELLGVLLKSTTQKRSRKRGENKQF